MGEDMNIATGTNRVVIGLRPREAAADVGSEEDEMADVEEEETTGTARDVTMTATAIEIATMTATETETETEVGALATNE
jgi:hypothetical protein